jgi:preprotein translocase subunit YajC
MMPALALAVLALSVVVVALVRRRLAVMRLTAALKPGDDVVLSGGIAGRVLLVDGDWIKLRLSRERGSPVVTALRSSVAARWGEP